MICIYHERDLDGWASAAIVARKYPDVELIGYDYGQAFDLNAINDAVIMVDVSMPMPDMVKIAKASGWRLTWIDHHVSVIKDFNSFVGDGESFCKAVLRDDIAACEGAWLHLFPGEPMPEGIRLLGMYDSFRHKGTHEELTVLTFQYGARAMASSPDEADVFIDLTEEGIWDVIKNGHAIYDYLTKEAVQKYKNRFTINFDGYYFAAINAERFNPINFGINYHNDRANDVYYYDGFACFWYNNRKWMFSLYNDNGEVDCSKICKVRGGGGHKGAAGFVTNDLSNVLNV